MQLMQDLSLKVICCNKCDRLLKYCKEVSVNKKRMYQEDVYWGKPVPGFGDYNSRILIIGLAPAAHGANRTGRMFTGDGEDGMGSSDFLISSLYRSGYANQPTSRSSSDGLLLNGVYLTSIVKCAPPANKPLKSEIENCTQYLHMELDLLKNLKVIIALGRLSFVQILKVLEERGAYISKPRPKFSHGNIINVGDKFPVLITSYHPSRLNTQTGRLTSEMLDQIMDIVTKI